jgi:uncharacterized protein YegP (UPF0339 family)
MAHYFEIKQNRAGEFVAYFKYDNETIFWTEGYQSEQSAKNAIEVILRNGPTAERRFATSSDPDSVQKAIDSADWTGLGRKITHENVIYIRSKANELLQAIFQSDADTQTKADAVRRVEAALLLLEAPNVPWRLVVELLNYPAVTAIMTALNLIQFIIGLAS